MPSNDITSIHVFVLLCNSPPELISGTVALADNELIDKDKLEEYVS
jgi:hypothetical protein